MASSAFGWAAQNAWKYRHHIFGAYNLGRKAYSAYRSMRSTLPRGTSSSSVRARAGNQGRPAAGNAYGGAMLAASHYRIRRRRVPKAVRHRRRVKKARFRRFAKRVRRAVGRKGPAPKWHIFRSTQTLDPGSDFTATGQALVDIVHGHSTHYDGLVALQSVATQNVSATEANWNPTFADRFLNVKKSYMVLFITNNSATSVYGKMGVFRPRKGINNPVMWPTPIASNDLNGRDAASAGPNAVTNEWLNPFNLTGFSAGEAYDDYTNMTDKVGPTNLTDIGWVWQNSPAFKRYYRGKIHNVTWAPMECKKFTFKLKKRINIDTSSEYTLRPATSALPAGSAPFAYGGALDWVITSSQTGFSEMMPRRGFFVSFMLHGIPARGDNDVSVGLTQPKMDMYWINAYKYAWSSPGKREFHVSTPNALAATTPFVAIPGFGTVPGAPQVGG